MFLEVDGPNSGKTTYAPGSMPHRCHKNSLRIFVIHYDASDLLRILETHVAPGLAAIDSLIDAIANAEVWSLQSLSTTDIDHIRI